MDEAELFGDSRMETVGVYLKKKRKAKNISLREVSRLTKISEFNLDYIEKDQYEKLPKGPYIKGYIASYSKAIGCNVDETLKLYDSLQRKKNECEASQPETSRFKGWKTSTASLEGKSKSSFNAVASSIKAKIALLKTAVPPGKILLVPLKKSISSLIAGTSKVKEAADFCIRKISSVKRNSDLEKIIEPTEQKKSDSLKNMVPIFQKATSTVITNCWSANRMIWLYACIALFGASILVFAGFGFYHLFIYDEDPPTADRLQISQNNEAPPILAIGAEKIVSPSLPRDTSEPSKQREQRAQIKELLPPHSPPENQNASSPLSATSNAEATRATSNSQESNNTAQPAIAAGTPPSSSALSAEDTASSRSAAGTETIAPSGQEHAAAASSPDSTTAAAILRVLKAHICSDVKNRMPVGVDTVFPASVQRVYVWNQIEAKQIPSKIRHVYYLDDRKMNDITLDVRSPNWRTWSYTSISNIRYRGEWRVDIALADGKVLQSLSFKIQ